MGNTRGKAGRSNTIGSARGGPVQRKSWPRWLVVAAAIAGCGWPDGSDAVDSTSLPLTQPAAPRLAWETVVNNASLIPNAGGKTFSSYNQPSVNGKGFVVFRARSTGSEGGGGEGETVLLPAAAEGSGSGSDAGSGAGSSPVRGIFTRDLGTKLTPGPVTPIAVTGGIAPSPNNLAAPFNEFPSIPRIDLLTRTVATRGQTRPVWQFALDDAGTTTKVGTSGVFANPGGVLQAGANLLGGVADYPTGQLVFPEYQVPGAVAGTRFDQFPGAPGLAGSTVVFKGNWTQDLGGGLTEGRTGVYYRDLSVPLSRVQRVADNVSSLIPGTTTLFGSTAPPSAAKGFMVFVGSDNEDNPTAGGVYRAPLRPNPTLQTLVKIGGRVPNASGQPTADTFTRFGEGLSFDGRYVAFWGAWGTATRSFQMQCAGDGNKEVIKYCVAQSLNKDGWYTHTVPVHQGLFVHDLQTKKTWMAAQTGPTFQDFLFWNFSGRAPSPKGGSEEESLEPPRWRSNAFAAVSAVGESTWQVAFKALRTNTVTGLYLVDGPYTRASRFTVLVDTHTSAWNVDLGAPPADATGLVPLLVTSMGIERDSFRSDGREDGSRYLVINVSMANADASVTWAGIYLARMRNDDDDHHGDD